MAMQGGLAAGRQMRGRNDGGTNGRPDGRNTAQADGGMDERADGLKSFFLIVVCHCILSTQDMLGLAKLGQCRIGEGQVGGVSSRNLHAAL